MTNERKTMVEMLFGSHLYGTATPASDKDFKGVFIPSMPDMMLGRVPKSLNFSTKQNSSQKNTSADTDREFYSVQYFFDLAKKGETVALDMLHAPKSSWLVCTPEWEHLHSKRSMFYTKNLSSLVGYARKQAAKYGVKGSRLAEVKAVLECMMVVMQSHPKCRVRDVVSMFPVSENCGMVDHEGSSVYNVCGRKLTMGAFVEHYVPMLENFIRQFGERAKAAELNEGVDWKAVSHAFRAAFQVRDLLIEGDFSYPLKETAFLCAVKNGTLHFKNEVAPELDTLMSEVEALSAASLLPTSVNDDAVDALLLELLSASK